MCRVLPKVTFVCAKLLYVFKNKNMFVKNIKTKSFIMDHLTGTKFVIDVM